MRICLLFCLSSGLFPTFNLTGDQAVSYTQFYLPFTSLSIGEKPLSVYMAVNTDLPVRPIQLSVVVSTACSNCHGAVFDPAESRSFHNTSVYEGLSLFPFGDVEGWQASDALTVPFYGPLRVDFLLVTKENFAYYEKVEGVLVLQK